MAGALSDQPISKEAMQESDTVHLNTKTWTT